MAQMLGKGPELSNLQIQELAEELDIGVPIMSYRVVGGRVELFLYGGGTAVAYLDADLDLSGYTVPQLRLIAEACGIPKAKRYRKSELLEVLATIDPPVLEEAAKLVP